MLQLFFLVVIISLNSLYKFDYTQRKRRPSGKKLSVYVYVCVCFCVYSPNYMDQVFSISFLQLFGKLLNCLSSAGKDKILIWGLPAMFFPCIYNLFISHFKSGVFLLHLPDPDMCLAFLSPPMIIFL